jgi:type II secretory pathway component GspD/PulD (secretin)
MPFPVRRPNERSLLKRVLLGAAVCLAATQLCACGSGPKPEINPVIGRHEGEMAPPVIISSTPARDLAAYMEGDEHLSDADWRVLEQFGPKSIWQQITGARWRRTHPPTTAPATSPTTRKHAKHRAHELQAAAGQQALAELPATTEPAAPSATQPTTGPSTQPSTQPATQPATRPATQPATQPTTQPAPSVAMAQAAAARPASGPASAPSTGPAIDEDDLPVEVVELPGNKVRIIWVLRSYGGSNVTTTRDGGTSRRTVAVAAPDLAPLVAVLAPSVGAGGVVTPLPKENTLVITCDRSMRGPVIDLLSRLDVPARQVEITVRIFEVSHDFDFQQGSNVILNHIASDGSQAAISAFSARRFLDAVGGGAPSAAAGAANGAAQAMGGGTAPVQGSVLHLVQTFSAAGVSADVSLQLLAESGLIHVVSSPRMTVAVGQTGYMLAGQELPIQSANIVNNVLQTATTYKPVGVQLYITPQAAGPEWVKLHTISIVSSISGFSPLPTLDGTDRPRVLINPIIDSREAETQVTVGDGDTLVISGLRMVRETSREEKVPGLAELPLLGWFFKNHRTQQQLTDLYFFLTPVVLEPNTTG